MFARLAVAVALISLLASTAGAQQFDRRARDEPEVVIEAGGRVGTCDVVRFTPDGNFLLAGGDDKVVRVWPHSLAGLDTSAGHARTLRWRSWRDQLGGIKAIGISPDGKRVAVGGYGLRISTVAILDRETGETVAITWPKTREGGNNFDAVMAVGFHPDGKRVGFGTADGSLWLWEPTKLAAPQDGRVWNAPVRVGRFDANRNAKGEEQFNFPRCIHFPDANTLVSVALTGQVLACDLHGKFTDDPSAPAPAGKTLFDVNAGQTVKYPVDKAEWTGDGQWLVVSTKGPLVLLRSVDGKRTVRLELPVDHFARSLAVHPKSGKVAVGVGSALPAVPGKPRFYMEGNDEIWLYENAIGDSVPPPKKLPHNGRAEALTFHPTEDRLVIAGGDADDITLLDLANPEKPVAVVHGTGRRLHAVNLAENGEVIGVKIGRNSTAMDPNDHAAGSWVRFNIPRFIASADESTKWVNPLTTANGWTIVPDTASRFVWHAERAKPDGIKERLRLALDPDLDQAPTCFTFLPPIEGKPTRVLIGHYYGCSLFELDPRRLTKNPRMGVAELPRTKLFIGHGAEVNSIVTDKKGTWFVTAGTDQTVAGWSLADWSTEPALGASFAIDSKQLMVRAVDVGSPAWEAGLSKGDRIERLAIGGKLTYDNRMGQAAIGTPEAAAASLAHPQSGVELFFGWQPVGQQGKRATPTRLKQRPLWKWFPAFDDHGRLTDSVIWIWHGSYYFTSSTHGDRMVGWHVNSPEVEGTPDYHPLERFKHLFLRPDVLSKLIGTRSVAEAFKEALGDNPVRKSFREFEPAPVDLAVKSAVVRPEGVALTVSVNPQGNNPDLLPERVELWVNDYRARVWAGKGKQAFAENVTIPASAFRAGENQITVLSLNPARGRAESTRFITNPTKPENPTLIGLAVGINDYAAHRQAVGGKRAFGDLGKARADATDLADRFLSFRGPGKFFHKGEVDTLLDANARRNDIIAELSKLKDAKVKPDDLLIVFLAGHGDLLGAGGKVPPVGKDVIGSRGFAADSGLFVFCCPDYTPAKSDATGLTGEELFDALAAVNCRKLVLLDACHAGGAVETNLLRRFIPNGQGPVVIAACDQSENSFEDDKLGHGVFTYAVLEAIGSKFRAADANTDGTLSPAELYEYVADRVPTLVRELRPGNTQNPICFPQPSALPKIALVKR